MKAVRFHRFGGPEVLSYEDAPEPAPGPGEVLVRVRACAVNHLDVWMRGGFRADLPLPRILGSDIAGEVVTAGAGVGWLSAGQRVLLVPGISCMHCAQCLAGQHNRCSDWGTVGVDRDGGYAERVVVPAINAVPLPDGLDFIAGAAVPMAFQTAWQQVVSRGQVGPGEQVLVWAASSGVGSAAVQIARLHGAWVLAISSGADRCRRLCDLGADVTIDYRREDVATAVRHHTGGRGVDLVVDNLGEAALAVSLPLLALGGRFVTIGATTGNRMEANLRTLLSGQLTIMGSRGGTKADFVAMLSHVATGRLRPVVHEVLTLAEAAKAHGLMEARGLFGKLVLAVT